jgi:hypothetical protein
MSTLNRWEPRVLYTFLIAKRDRAHNLIEQRLVDRALVRLFESLRKALGGVTKMRPFEAVGSTSEWGREPTTVVLVLAKVAEEETADNSVATQGASLTQTLAQDEVWIAKQTLHLHIARYTG